MGYTIFWDQLRFSEFTYENVCTVVPRVINVKFCRESWGFSVGDSDEECVAIEKVPTTITYVKTNRDPYSINVMKTLIVMVEFGAAWHLGHDDGSMALYLKALDEVHAIHPLVSYEQQKTYFVDAERHHKLADT
jgi:hypothetical protein